MPSPFENLDLSKLTVEDIRKIESAPLRTALLNSLLRRDDTVASHQNHGSHGDHNTSSVAEMELQFAKNLLQRPR
jgi:hypothetical protein